MYIHICSNYFKYVYIVVEVTVNRAQYGSQQSDQPKNSNFEPIIRRLKSDIFTETKCKIQLHKVG